MYVLDATGSAMVYASILSVIGSFESPTVQACVPQMLSGGLPCVVRNILKINQVSSSVSYCKNMLTYKGFFANIKKV